MTLTFEQLEALRSIVSAGTFSRAADEMFLSQPAISERIRHLEKALGAKLFHTDANRRVIRLTPAGEHALRFAEDVATGLRRLETAIQSDRDQQQGGAVNLACGLIPARYVLPDLLDAYHKLYPLTHVNLIEATGDRICSLLREGKAELAILGDNYIASGFPRITLLSDRAVLVAAAGHPVLSGADDWLRSRKACPLIAGPPHSLGRLIAQRWSAHFGVTLDVVVETTSMNVIKETVMRGLGLTVLPEVAIADEVRDGRLEIVSVRGMPREWRICVTFNRRRALCPAAQSFLDMALATARRLSLRSLPASQSISDQPRRRGRSVPSPRP